LHGFLGSKDDWEEVIAYLPNCECIALDYPFTIPDNGILIGYSMGGRIVLRYPHPKIILSAHPGLQDPQEKQKRQQTDLEWIRTIETHPFHAFLEKWYAQPLFDSLRAHPHFPKIFSRRLKLDPQKAIQQLKEESLSSQNYTSSNAIFLHGEKDLKYAALYTKLHLNAISIKGAGHAIHLESPKACADIILERSRELHRHQVP